MNRIALAIAVLLLAPVALAQEVKIISTADLFARHKNGAGDVVLVDSRGKVEFGEGHIKGAVLVPPARTGELLPTVAKSKAGAVVFYCNGPTCARSRKAAKIALGLGYTNVAEYTGGLPAWKAAGHPTEGAPPPAFPLPPGTSPKAASTELATLNVIDLREADEFQAFRIQGARSFPLDDLERLLPTLPKGPLFLVDHSGQRVWMAGRLLAKLGRKELRWLEGGMIAWNDAGLPTEGK
jgi:rhodanese-related sulfurtransferase